MHMRPGRPVTAYSVRVDAQDGKTEKWKSYGGGKESTLGLTHNQTKTHRRSKQGGKTIIK